MDPRPSAPRPVLQRRLGTGDAVTIGLGSMIGAGVFASFAPAARAAGSGLLLGLAIAAVVAYCNATSSARLAALYPESGGTYVYGRRRLGPFWGYLAGWSFVVGKTASCAAMALTFGAYAAPSQARAVGAVAVVALTLLSLAGVRKSLWATRLIVAAVLAVLAAVVVACLTSGRASIHSLSPFPGSDVHGVLQSAGLLFFAFAGYARIATLGEEVRDPGRTIPRAIGVALGVTVVVYALVGFAALSVGGADVLGATTSPLRAAVDAAGAGRLSGVVRVGGALAAVGSLLALLLGVSRTTFAMARDRHLPSVLTRTSTRTSTPAGAEIAVGTVVLVLVLTTDLRSAIGFSSFGVLVYYGIANAAARTLSAAERRPPRWLPLLGVTGCAVLAVSLPVIATVTGAAVLAVGALAYAVSARHRPGAH